MHEETAPPPEPKFRRYGHYAWAVNGASAHSRLSVGRPRSRSFDCQLEVVPVDVDLT